MFDTASGWLITRLDVNPIIAPLFSQDAAYRTPNRPHFTARTCLKDTICARSPQKKFIWPMSVKISRISELLEGGVGPSGAEPRGDGPAPNILVDQ